MSFYVAQARSNVFKVKNLAKFKAFCKKWYTPVQKYDAGVSISGGDDDTGGWQRYGEDENGVELEFEDFLLELSKHLKGDSVAVLMECGYDNAWPSGYAVAVNSKGYSARIDVWDIFDKAKKMGSVQIPE